METTSGSTSSSERRRQILKLHTDRTSVGAVGTCGNWGSHRIPFHALLDDPLLILHLRLQILVALHDTLHLRVSCLLQLVSRRPESLHQASHLHLLLVQELLLAGGDPRFTLLLPLGMLSGLKLVSLDLCLFSLCVLLHLCQRLLDFPQVQQVSAPARCPRLHLSSELVELHDVFLLVPSGQGGLKIASMPIKVLLLFVPDRVELL
mmetsp:Transcript_52672/g.85391  ORF Transcript_52672/g.85391 Transcript_52672/m.85391 type:complete len:206 (-) Transcript_52672:369-986(-)